MPKVATPNITGWTPSRPDSRDHTLRMSLPNLSTLAFPASVPSLTKSFPILNQGNLGSCTAYATGRAFRFIDGLDGIHFDISELYAYWWGRFHSGLPADQDTGAYNRGAAKAWEENGAAKESLWAYDISKFKIKPPAAVDLEAAKKKAVEYISVPNDTNVMKSLIAAGFPIVIGFTVYSNYQSSFATGIWPEAGGTAEGGHAVIVDGYDENWWDVPNSWGTGIGQAGWFKMSQNFVRQNGADFWTFKKVTGDVVVPPPPPPTPDPDFLAWIDSLSAAEFDALVIRKHGPVDQIPVIFEDGYTWPTRIERPT